MVPNLPVYCNTYSVTTVTVNYMYLIYPFSTVTAVTVKYRYNMYHLLNYIL